MRRSNRSLVVLLAIVLFAALPLAAADVTNPDEVANVMLNISDGDIVLTWDSVTLDVTGNPETIGNYEVYRGTAATFIPDKASGTNKIGSPLTESFTDTGAVAGPDPVTFYLVSAVDQDLNEGITRASTVTSPPTLGGFWTDTSIELDWNQAQPSGDVAYYRIYRGESVGNYDFAQDIALDQVFSSTGLTLNILYHYAVTAIDTAGNESQLSNEHTDVLEGRYSFLAHNDDELCWGGGCDPTDPTYVQRDGGWQLLVPTDFPAGDWVKIEVDFTMASKLCTPPAGGNVSKCGPGNPCVSPPCNGGYNTCGDPWDRTAHLFMVLDDCIDQGVQCMNHDNIELMRSVTPFGTDARPPDGPGTVPPRKLTMDITPFAPLLAGQQRFIGAHIGHFTQGGWWVTTQFRMSKRVEESSPKPPADGIEPIFFHSSGAEVTGPFPVSIPADALQVTGRLFITGHGGGSDPVCPNPADEFCQRTNRILVDSAQAWADVPWRDCCYPRGSAQCLGCTDWNACGYPSCTFDRSGWCPGEIACHDNLDEGCDQDLPMTGALTPGVSHDIEYMVQDVNGSWSRSLVVYWYNEITQFCGNNIQEGTEVCDGTDLNGETCQSQGFDTGDLFCNVGCGGYDTSSCRDWQCGNNICELSAGEDCVSCGADCNGVQGGNPDG
ncbi:MAG: peptide-N-glycosidase F-related protein, partial [Acidobacteriota bacterium]|nr:peptide-N-glycosidase F-related protein [Acidobacteriota bacterium]